MKLYNTLTRQLEEFTPLAPPKVNMYVCGPTVYDDPHIGHARSAFTFDILRRYLAFKGYRVTFVRNVTDVDDKIIGKARETGGADLNATCRQVSEQYLASYHAAMDRMGLLRPDREPKATDHVVPDPGNVELTKQIDASMTGYISRLLTQGMAYPAGGDVYFSVRKLPGYGALSNRSVEELQSGARIEPGEQKQDPLDFALWKAAKPGEPSWNSPWGPGRPGWHIECTVMATTYLGDAFDIHGGGVDLVFPHHENEVAQARGLGKPFAKYWVHNGLLTVKNEKMSKSLGNYTTLEKALQDCGGSTDVLKTFFLGAHYRSPIDYAPDAIRSAATRFDRWLNVFYLGRYKSEEYDAAPELQDLARFRKEFEAAMDDDLNTPRAVAVLDGLASLGLQWRVEIQTLPEGAPEERILKGKIRAISSLIGQIGELFGFKFEVVDKGHKVRELAEELLQQREDARRAKDFRLADGIRNRIHALGYTVEDTPKGPQLVAKR